MDNRIAQYAEANNLNITGQYGRDRRAREVKYYTVVTDTGIRLGVIQRNCTYTTFLENIALEAISEAERLSDLTKVMEAEYNELCEDYEALKEEVTNEREDN